MLVDCAFCHSSTILEPLGVYSEGVGLGGEGSPRTHCFRILNYIFDKIVPQIWKFSPDGLISYPLRDLETSDITFEGKILCNGVLIDGWMDGWLDRLM